MAGAYKAGADRSHRRLTHWIEALDVWSTKAGSGHRRPETVEEQLICQHPKLR